MAVTINPQQLEDAMARRGIESDAGNTQMLSFITGWNLREKGDPPMCPYRDGSSQAVRFHEGYGDAEDAGITFTREPVIHRQPPLPAMDARSYFAAAALQGCCANQGEYGDINTKELAAVCWRFADVMIAARDAKDRSTAA